MDDANLTAEPTVELTPVASEPSILFCDIDGVLNPFLAKSGLHGDWRKYPVLSPDGAETRVWVSKHLGGWINGLIASDVTFVWATTWIDYPSELEQYCAVLEIPNGLDRITFVPNTSPRFGRHNCGKLSGIQEWLDDRNLDPTKRRIVWIDDELGPDDKEWARSNGVLAVKTNPGSGLASFKLRQPIAEHLGATA